MKKRIFALALAAALLLGCGAVTGSARAASSDSSTILAPVLMYTYAGAYPGANGQPLWCEESYHSTPAIADVDGDGALEIIGAAYTLFCVDAKTGTVKWKAPSGHDSSQPDAKYDGRVWSDIIVADVDADGALEIVTGDERGRLSVYDGQGRYKPGWPQKLTTPDQGAVNMEITSVRVSDLDKDGTMEIVAAIGEDEYPSKVNTWVYEHDGKVRSGWPQYVQGVTDGGMLMSHAWGVYSDALAVDDMNGDGYPEIYVPSDVPTICAYDSYGKPIAANSRVFGSNVAWGTVGVFMDADYEATVENGGWWGYSTDGFTGNPLLLSAVPTGHRYTADFTFSGPVIDDLDGDGKKEMAVVGRVYDWANGYPLKPHATKFQSLFIFNADRTRFVSRDGQDWSVTPISGAPVCEDYKVMPVCSAQVVSVDLDGDGKKELVYPTYDGKLNCTWLDKTQKYSWPINVYDGSTFEMATAPAVVDLDKDGRPELIFGTYTKADKGGKIGSLCIANYKGEIIQKVTLPKSLEGDQVTANGCINTPAVADIDGDGLYEAALMGHWSALTVYKLPTLQAGSTQKAAKANVSVPLNTSWQSPTAALVKQDSAGTQPYMSWLYNTYVRDSYHLYPCGTMRAQTFGTRFVLINPETGAKLSKEYFSWIDISPTRAVVMRQEKDTNWESWFGLLDLTTGKEIMAPTSSTCVWNGASLAVSRYTSSTTAASLDDGKGGTLKFAYQTFTIESSGDPHAGLVPITSGGKKGYMSPSGKILVPAQYDELSVVGEKGQYFLARKSGKYGIFDKTGKVVFPFLFEHVWAVQGSDAVYARYGSYLGEVLPENYKAWSTFADQTVTMGPAAKDDTVKPLQTKLRLNGQDTTLSAYMIVETSEGYGSNYVKLRDVAQLLDATSARFQVSWAAKVGITLTTGQHYTAVGGEGTLKGGDNPRPFAYNLDTITLNGKPITLKAYTIDQNNYFKLRDLGDALGFTVGWDNATGTVLLTTP